MPDFFKVIFILTLFYLAFPFLFSIPSNSIFLRPHELHLKVCTKLQLPVVCEAPSLNIAVIKPDGMAYEKQMIDILEANRFHIMQDKTLQLTKEQVGKWYLEKRDEPYYPSLEKYLTERGPIRVLVLSRIQAIPALRSLIGPTNPSQARQSFPKSIRALYGTNVQENAIHASDSKDSAAFEFDLFFPPTGTNTRHF